MIDLALIVAVLGACGICARLGFMRGRVVGERSSLELQRRVLQEAEEVMKVSEQAHTALKQYQSLFEQAQPILEEHTWHKTEGGSK